MNVDAAQWVGRRYALAGRPLSACPFDANGEPDQRVFAARFVQGYLDAEPSAVRSVDLNEDDLLRSDVDDEDEPDGEEPDDGENLDADLDDEELDEDEALDEHVAEAEEFEAELEDDIEDDAERSDYLDDDDILRAMDRNQLKHYWTKSAEGLAKWLPKRKQWTALYRHLRKYVGSERAKRMAAEWVHEVTGNWPGSDAHRVATGHKPRGKRIGPG